MRYVFCKKEQSSHFTDSVNQQSPLSTQTPCCSFWKTVFQKLQGFFLGAEVDACFGGLHAFHWFLCHREKCHFPDAQDFVQKKLFKGFFFGSFKERTDNHNCPPK